MRTTIVLIFFLIACEPLYAKQPRTAPPPTETSTPSLVREQPSNRVELNLQDPHLMDALVQWLGASATRQPASAAIEVKLVDPQLQAAITERLQKENAKPEAQGFWAKFTENGVAVGTVVGAVTTGILAGILSLVQSIASERLRAGLERDEAIRRIRFRRLEMFHAPLRALTQQSRGVADKLYHQIYALKDTGLWGKRQLAFMTEEEAKTGKVPTDAEMAAEEPRRRVYIHHNGKWITLRMLDFMPVLLSDASCKQLVDVIIDIGRKMTAVIVEHGGLAASGQDPSPVFGQYLAHFLILERLHKNPPATAFDPESQKVGYYPMKFDEIVESGYQQARTDIAKYEKKSK